MEKPSEFCKKHNITDTQKWYISIFSGILFLILTLPMTFRLTNSLFSGLGMPTIIGNTPTMTGIIIHAVVYILITRFSMG